MSYHLYLKYKEATREAYEYPNVSDIHVGNIRNEDLASTYKILFSRGNAAERSVRQRILYKEKYIPEEKRDEGHDLAINMIKEYRDLCFSKLKKIGEKYNSYIDSLKRSSEKVKPKIKSCQKKKKVEVKTVVSLKEIEDSYLESVKERDVYVDRYKEKVFVLLSRCKIDIDNLRELSLYYFIESIPVHICSKSLSLLDINSLEIMLNSWDEKTKSFDEKDMKESLELANKVKDEKEIPYFSVKIRYNKETKPVHMFLNRTMYVRDMLYNLSGFLNDIVGIKLFDLYREYMEFMNNKGKFVDNNALGYKVLTPRENLILFEFRDGKDTVSNICLSVLGRLIRLENPTDEHKETYNKIRKFLVELYKDNPRYNHIKDYPEFFTIKKIPRKATDKDMTMGLHLNCHYRDMSVIQPDPIGPICDDYFCDHK